LLEETKVGSIFAEYHQLKAMYSKKITDKIKAYYGITPNTVKFHELGL